MRPQKKPIRLMATRALKPRYCPATICALRKPRLVCEKNSVRTKMSSMLVAAKVTVAVASVVTIGDISRASRHTPNENKMSDGGGERASLGVEVWKSSQKWSVQRSPFAPSHG